MSEGYSWQEPSYIRDLESEMHETLSGEAAQKRKAALAELRVYAGEHLFAALRRDDLLQMPWNEHVEKVENYRQEVPAASYGIPEKYWHYGRAEICVSDIFPTPELADRYRTVRDRQSKVGQFRSMISEKNKDGSINFSAVLSGLQLFLKPNDLNWQALVDQKERDEAFGTVRQLNDSGLLRSMPGEKLAKALGACLQQYDVENPPQPCAPSKHAAGQRTPEGQARGPNG